MPIKKHWYMAVAICLVIMTTANLVMTIKVSQDIKVISAVSPKPRSLPCESIPVRFALDHPDCVNELLYHMNVTNVRFLSRINLSK